MVYGTPGLKDIELTVTNEDGVSISSMQEAYITVGSLPDLELEDTSRCGSGEILVRANSETADIVQFSTDGGITVFCEAVAAPYECSVFVEEGQEAIVWARAIDTTGGCATGWDLTANLYAYPLPDLELEDTSRCGSGEILVRANSETADIVQFSTDGGMSVCCEAVTFPYQCSVYVEEYHRVIIWARAIDTTGGCATRWDQTAILYAYPVPEAIIIGDSILCNDEELYLTAGQDENIERYQWQDGSTLDFYTTDREEVVTLTVWNHLGCQDSDSLIIGTCEQKDLFSANLYTFSPNADGVNDYWILDNIEDYPEAKIWVYDAAGSIVFHSPGGYQNDWDGTCNGQILPVDSYYFVIDFSKYNKGILTGLLTILYLD